MITIRKLQSLPASTRRRKIVRILESWVREGTVHDRRYTRELLATVRDDEGLPEAVRDAGRSAADTLDLRAVDRLRHLLMQHLRMEPGEWDLIPPRRQSFGGEGDTSPGAEASAGDDGGGAGVPSLTSVGLYLESIRSPFNVGSIIRSAAAFGVHTIGVSDDVPAVDHPRVTRSAMGAAAHVAIVRGALDELAARVEGPLIALELGGEPLSSFSFPRGGVLMLGSEELGLSPELLARARYRISIPMPGPKASLNVGVACGIALAAWQAAIR
jgi:TrmH family RNA methyltransferase